MSPLLLAGLLGLFTALAMWVRSMKAAKSTAGPSLPPGPKPVPILGNVRDLSPRELWLLATAWAKEYGDVTYLHVFGQGLVFLSSPEATSDLLDKKGSLYSDKPHLIMAGELCGCENMVAFTPYGDKSKRQRRLLNQAFGINAISSYYPLIQASTHRFLRGLVASPSDYIPLTRVYAGGLTLSVVYGYQPKSAADPMVMLAEECVDIISNRIASGGGIWPVDLIPSLQNLPEWFPGGGFKKNARIWKAKMEEFVEKPYDFLKNSIKSGNYMPSFCSTILEETESSKQTPELQFDLKWTANSMYSASIDTTITAVSHALLAVMEHPEALLKAQAELDKVVGSDRLPTFADRASLPYVECLIKEIYRWGVPVPLNLPHRLTEDDVYRGMHIPKGSLIFGNIWAICHDPSIYPEPERFLPERFLVEADAATSKRRDPTTYVFGFGRRRCPGANLVDSSVWLLLASMFATLDISKAKDEQGNIIEPNPKFENAVFRTPSPFKCDMRPRSPQALKLIRESEILA